MDAAHHLPRMASGKMINAAHPQGVSARDPPISRSGAIARYTSPYVPPSAPSKQETTPAIMHTPPTERAKRTPRNALSLLLDQRTTVSAIQSTKRNRANSARQMRPSVLYLPRWLLRPGQIEPSHAPLFSAVDYSEKDRMGPIEAVRGLRRAQRGSGKGEGWTSLPTLQWS